MAARLPASALGCAARQDVEPSATQPGDHPRVQAALVASLPPVLPRESSSPPRASPRDISFAVLDGVHERGAPPARPPSPFFPGNPRANILRGPSYPPATRTPLRGFGLRPNCSFARTARTFSQVNNTRDTPPYRCSRALFARVASQRTNGATSLSSIARGRKMSKARAFRLSPRRDVSLVTLNISEEYQEYQEYMMYKE